MAEKPYMKFWVGDYLTKTHHLSVQEHGAYVRLLMEAWATPTCSLPDDPAWIKRRLHVTDDEFDEFVKPIIDEFWTKEVHRIFQKRQRKEFENAIYRSEMAKSAANKRHHGRKVIPLKTKEDE